LIKRWREEKKGSERRDNFWNSLKRGWENRNHEQTDQRHDQSRSLRQRLAPCFVVFRTKGTSANFLCCEILHSRSQLLFNLMRSFFRTSVKGPSSFSARCFLGFRFLIPSASLSPYECPRTSLQPSRTGSVPFLRQMSSDSSKPPASSTPSLSASAPTSNKIRRDQLLLSVFPNPARGGGF
jgi:hypothetical protein